MLTAVAFVPQAPALIPDLGRGLEQELAPVRDACRTAIRRVATPGTRIVVVGHVDSTAGLGRDVAAPTVGEWLVRDAIGPRDDVVHVPVSNEVSDLAEQRLHEQDPVALVVVGDGSACRSEKAPGHLDDRAETFDRDVARTLKSGIGDALHTPEADRRVLVRELLVAGDAAWNTVAWHTESVDWDAELLYDDAPFGVGYFVAVWTRAEH